MRLISMLKAFANAFKSQILNFKAESPTWRERLGAKWIWKWAARKSSDRIEKKNSRTTLSVWHKSWQQTRSQAVLKKVCWLSRIVSLWVNHTPKTRMEWEYYNKNVLLFGWAYCSSHCERPPWHASGFGQMNKPIGMNDIYLMYECFSADRIEMRRLFFYQIKTDLVDRCAARRKTHTLYTVQRELRERDDGRAKEIETKAANEAGICVVTQIGFKC